MAKYKPQYKKEDGTIADLELCAKYDCNGTQIDTNYARRSDIETLQAAIQALEARIAALESGSSWAIGSDLSGKTIKCTSLSSNPFDFYGIYDYEQGYQLGMGDDVYLTVVFQNGRNLIFKDGAYVTDYDTIEYGGQYYFSDSGNDWNSGQYVYGYAYDIYLEEGSVITGFIWQNTYYNPSDDFTAELLDGLNLLE